MTRHALAIAALATLLSAGTTFAQQANDSKDPKAEMYSQLARGPACVCKLEKDGTGRIESLLIVGKSPIHTSLGVTKAIEVATQRATNDAKAKFLQWLGEKAKVRVSQEDETIVLQEGTEDDKDGATRESSKAIEKNTTKFETVSKHLLRGLQMVYFEQQGKDKTYVVILKYSAKATEAAADAASDKASKSGEKGAGKKTVPDKKGVIPD
jgi:hypothetical protein